MAPKAVSCPVKSVTALSLLTVSLSDMLKLQNLSSQYIQEKNNTNIQVLLPFSLRSPSIFVQARDRKTHEKMKRKFDAGASSSSSTPCSKKAQGTPWEIQMLKTILDQAADIHKESTLRIQGLIQQAVNEINKVIQAMQSSEAGTDYTSIIDSLKERINNLAPQPQMERLNNMTEEPFDKFLTVLNCVFHTDISKAFMKTKYAEPEIVNQIVVNYLYRHNHFEAGDVFIREAGVPEAFTFRSHYKEMHEILRAFGEHNVAPAMHWIQKNKGHPELTEPRLEFELYRQQFMEMLKSDVEPLEAVKFIRTHLTPFDSFYLEEIKNLASCVLWISRLDESPYADLLSSAKWDKLADNFTEKFFGMLGQSTKCPLTTVCNVGARNIPLLSSLRRIVGDKAEWESIESLPLYNETDAGEECNFHSVFVCKECREMATDVNPPILLPCCHTLCWNTVTRLSWGGDRLFICPFCFIEIHLNQCFQLHV